MEKKTGNKQNKPKKRKIMFVCTGNTCRSPMAEYILKDILKKNRRLSEFTISSSGIYAEAGSKMSFFSLSALKELNINGEKFLSKRFKPSMLKSNDLIIAMTKGHKNAIGTHHNVFTLGELTGGEDVLDPYGLSLDSYTSVCSQLIRMLIEFYEKILKRH